jgi:hypothetical protein
MLLHLSDNSLLLTPSAYTAHASNVGGAGNPMTLCLQEASAANTSQATDVVLVQAPNPKGTSPMG